MIRPRLRPTVSRRNRYLSIAPRAEKKLYRESRRGSHDLRRLVGHANFLDDLADSLEPGTSSDDELDFADAPTNDNVDNTTTSALSDGESTASEEEWSDDEDDEDHALVRTVSGRPLVTLATEREDIQDPPIRESGGDYFSRPATLAETVLAVLEESKVAADITVNEVTSSLSDLADELRSGSFHTAHPEESAGDEKPAAAGRVLEGH